MEFGGCGGPVMSFLTVSVFLLMVLQDSNYGCDGGLVRHVYLCGIDFADGLVRLVQFPVDGLVKQGSLC